MNDSALERVIALAEKLPFVVLVGWLERLTESKACVGGSGPYHDEPVHFRHDPGLGFHSRDVSDAQLLTLPDGRRRAHLQTTFLGLTGSSSPLPSMLLDGLARDDDDELLRREFLDVFHHRLLSLLYRGLRKFDLPRSAQEPGSARALDWLLLLGGLLPAHAERITGLPRHLLLRFAPLLVTYPANGERLATALRCALEDLLGDAEVRIAEMQGGYVDIDESSRARLGIDLRLGRTSTLGSRAPAPASGIVAQIAPLSPASCARLGPGGDRFALLCAVALLFCPETVQIAVELTPTHTPPSRLGFPSSTLGRNAWLGGRGRPLPVRFGIEPNDAETYAWGAEPEQASTSGA